MIPYVTNKVIQLMLLYDAMAVTARHAAAAAADGLFE